MSTRMSIDSKRPKLATRTEGQENKKETVIKSNKRKLDKDHPEFELAYDMMFGIRFVNGLANQMNIMHEDLKMRVTGAEMTICNGLYAPVLMKDHIVRHNERVLYRKEGKEERPIWLCCSRSLLIQDEMDEKKMKEIGKKWVICTTEEKDRNEQGSYGFAIGEDNQHIRPDFTKQWACKLVDKYIPSATMEIHCVEDTIIELSKSMSAAPEHSVSKSKAHENGEGFNDRRTIFFPGHGSGGNASKGEPPTPGHKMRDFYFKDYAPQAFKHLRKMCGLSETDYVLSLCGEFEFLEFVSNSKSGGFFFLTHDERYMVKTISKAECTFFRKILPEYLNHYRNYPDSLINRMFGMYKVKPYKKNEYRFLVLDCTYRNNLFLPIHKKFDLKGSTRGRAVTEKEKKKGNPIFKDLDFLEQKQKFHLSASVAKKFRETIAADAALLGKLNICDYSLLVCIHNRSNVPPSSPRTNLGTGVKAVQAQATKFQGTGAELTVIPADYEESKHDAPDDAADEEGDADAPTRSNRRNSNQLSQAPLFLRQESKPNKVQLELLRQLNAAFEGGVSSINDDGTRGEEIYYFGVIDFLIAYDFQKGAEAKFKGLLYDANTVSAMAPGGYAARFRKFMEDAVVEHKDVDVEQYEEWQADARGIDMSRLPAKLAEQKAAPAPASNTALTPVECVAAIPAPASFARASADELASPNDDDLPPPDDDLPPPDDLPGNSHVSVLRAPSMPAPDE